MKEQWEALTEELAEGEVYFFNLPEVDDYYLTKLKMMPHSKIKWHEDLTFDEIYLDAENDTMDFYPRGVSHGFINDTDKIVNLLLVKRSPIT